MQREREGRIAEAAERGVSREEFEAKESAAAEDARCAHELEITRYRARQGPPEYDGTRKVTDDEKQAFRDELTAKQEKALERFRTEPVEGPDNRPIDPDRHRNFVAGHWRRGDPPFPAGDLDRRDELLYTRREPREPRPDEAEDLQARSELAGATVSVGERARERFPDGVQHDEGGHPDLARYASKTVYLDNRHDTPKADERANELFGWDTTPENKTWHKVSDGHTVLLVDADLHRQFDPTHQGPSTSDHRSVEPPTRSAEATIEPGDVDASRPSDHDRATDENQPAGEVNADLGDAEAGASSDRATFVIRGDAALAGLTFDPSTRREALGDCFRPGVYDAHNSLDQRSPEQAHQVLRTAQQAADLGARIDLHDRTWDLTIRWDEHDTGTVADLDSLSALLDGWPAPASGRGQDEVPRQPNSSVLDGGTPVEVGNRWDDPDKRQKWVEDWLADPAHVNAVRSDAPWAHYQRAHAGDLEVKLQTDDPADGIWADGLALDPDRVVAVEAKYVTRSGRSMYEGTAPAPILNELLRDFDKEMRRYGNIARHEENPIERIRIVTNTDAAARFLGERARKVIGTDVDLEIQVRPEGED